MIQIDKKMAHEAKIEAAKRGITLKALIENALKEYLTRTKKGVK